MEGKAFGQALEGEDEVQVTFVRSKSGEAKTLPVWFVVDGGAVRLLPMYGLKTKWFRDVEKSGKVGLGTKGKEMSASPKIVKDAKEVERVKGLFSKKYGPSDVKKYYPTSEVTLEIRL